MPLNTLNLGRWNDLPIVRFTEHGAYLDAGVTGEILMPRAYVTREMRPGDIVHVFVYLDQQERLVATTEKPLAQVGEFAFLRVSWVNRYGAFLDWGLMKDLFVPFSEQKTKMVQGRSYLVFIYIDRETRRIVGSAKVEHFIDPSQPGYEREQEVDVIVWQRTPLGYKVIVDNRYAGLIYEDQTYHAELRIGDRMRGYIMKEHPDGKLDISLQRLGKERFLDFSQVLMQRLEEAGGFLPYTDKSDAEDIAETFGVSKKTFKRAVGTLYKQRLILLGDDGITLNDRR